MDAVLAEQLVELLEDLVNEVNQLGFWLMFVLVALAVIAHRVGKGRSSYDNEDGGEGEQKTRRRSNNNAALLARGVGKVYELTTAYGIASFNGFATDRVRVVDCDDEWVRVESTNPKKPGQAVIRIAAIEGVKEISETNGAR